MLSEIDFEIDYRQDICPINFPMASGVVQLITELLENDYSKELFFSFTAATRSHTMCERKTRYLFTRVVLVSASM